MRVPWCNEIEAQFPYLPLAHTPLNHVPPRSSSVRRRRVGGMAGDQVDVCIVVLSIVPLCIPSQNTGIARILR